MSGKRVAIVQSSYIPWKGYFDLIRASDEFILLDDVQFTKRDWRSRNQIKTQHGLAWLTIPVRTKGRYFQSIQETEISDAAMGRSPLGYALAPTTRGRRSSRRTPTHSPRSSSRGHESSASAR